MCLHPDRGAVRRDTQYVGDPARIIGSLLWEVAALGRGRVRERDSLGGSEDMQGRIKKGGRGGTGRTLTAICGTVSIFKEGACLANLLAIGEPRGAGAGEGAASLAGVFSLEGAGLAICEDRWPRPLLGGRRPRFDLDSQLTIVDGQGNREVAKRKGKLWATTECAV